MKGWVKKALTKLKEYNNCDHTVGIYNGYDPADTELVQLSDIKDKKEHPWQITKDDVDLFNYCPDCAERICL
jgi:hypothetical protein